MPRPRREWRGDQLHCRYHDDWHHHSRFGKRKRKNPENPDVDIWDYDVDCKLGLEDQRISKKHVDPALHIVEARAKKIVTAANKAEGPKIGIDFVMGALNYRCLVPMVRAAILWPDESICPNCACRYDNPLEFDHRAPPRHSRDWARLHARNLGPLDHECNSAKGPREYNEWLDLEESKRLDVEAHHQRRAEAPSAGPVPGGQQSLFGGAA